MPAGLLPMVGNPHMSKTTLGTLLSPWYSKTDRYIHNWLRYNRLCTYFHNQPSVYTFRFSSTPRPGSGSTARCFSGRGQSESSTVHPVNLLIGITLQESRNLTALSRRRRACDRKQELIGRRPCRQDVDDLQRDTRSSQRPRLQRGSPASLCLQEGSLQLISEQGPACE